MKIRTIIQASTATIALFAANPALADGHQDHAEAATEATAKAIPAGPAMWKVADEDTTIYLFGTVHALPKDLDWYRDDIAAALTSADTLVTEIPMDAESEAKVQAVAMAASALPEGTTLRSLLNEEQTAAYEAALTKLGVPAPAFDRFEPWMAGLTLTMLPLLQQGYSPDTGVEKVLLTKVADKDRAALETPEFQIGIFDSLPQEKQIAFMMEAIEGMDDAKGALDAMVDEWIEGDADALAELMNEGLTDAEIAKALLYDRNANWATWIADRLDQPGTVFIAVGAGHLAGDKSVQDILTQNNIEVQRVR